ncbi:DNA gyrase B [Nannocystis exedens]|uniref:DNA topoisomerase (ATP-hydrolyzing) n=1 Tax=Nannocystis exedens TaxID=54 RepID=A0A1I2GQ85_9BACT|nr:ATP-binding protein [Nannocystis exedens]PCC68734.1 DNA gyrase subunit B [Nannocystis exedens]SFF19393.1 DNA gyrase B [Nannocystis exedens]
MASDYTADTIQVLTLHEAVRRRPRMYIRSTDDGAGPLHMLLEIVDRAIDQIVLGRCTRVDVRIDADDFVTVSDDGPGIPAGSLVEVLERPSRPPTVDRHRPRFHLGLHGLGLAVANALSDPFEVDTVHAGEQATVAYAGGLRHVPLRVNAASRPSGTRVRFRPDPQIFQCMRVPRVELTRRLEDLAFLLPANALSWSFAGERATGLVARVRAEFPGPLGDVAHHQSEYATEHGPTPVEVALAWRSEPRGRPAQLLGYVNLQHMEDGPHVTGLLAGIRDFLQIRSERPLEGLVAAVAVRLADSEYGRQTMSPPIHSSVYSAVKEATSTALQRWAERAPEDADALRRRVKAGEPDESSKGQPGRRPRRPR